MNHDREWSTASWTTSPWDKSGSSGWNNRDWQRGQSSVPDATVSIPSSFVSDWGCYDTTPVSNKKFFRNIQSTPWSTKSGLAGKDVANLRVAELTRKGLDDYSLRCLSILGPKAASQSQQMQHFCDPHFYQGIVLERASDHLWLGFTIDATARTATFNMPEQPWQLRSPASAGSWKLATSGYFSRASLIRQYTWPPETTPGQIRRLKQLYVQAGFPATALQ